MTSSLSIPVLVVDRRTIMAMFNFDRSFVENWMAGGEGPIPQMPHIPASRSDSTSNKSRLGISNTSSAEANHPAANLPVPDFMSLHPTENKFHKGNGDDQKHYWLTPPELYARLDAEFNFDFDPCPHPLPEGFDGLTCEWGQRNYVNPPFGSIMHNGRKKGPTAWMRKAMAEQAKGKLSVVVYPVDKWVLLMLANAGSAVRNLGDVKWHAIEDGSPGKGTGRHIACFILKP